ASGGPAWAGRSSAAGRPLGGGWGGRGRGAPPGGGGGGSLPPVSRGATGTATASAARAPPAHSQGARDRWWGSCFAGGGVSCAAAARTVAFGRAVSGVGFDLPTGRSGEGGVSAAARAGPA